MENKYIWKWMLALFLSLLALMLLVVAFRSEALAWVSVYDSCKWFLTCGSESRTEITLHDEIKWTPKPLEAPKKKEPVKVPPKVEKPKETTKEVTINNCTSKVRNDLVNHAYRISGGDMKFVWTIASESMYDVGSIGDNGHSVWLCQFHRLYQPDNHRIYKTLKTDKEKLEFCHEKYEIWRKRGVLSTRLYGSNVWQNGLKKLEINCKAWT